MKKCALQVISICLAFFMAFISGGLNIYHYCCDACAEHGRDIFHIMSCKEVHSDAHNEECDIHHDMAIYDCCMHDESDECLTKEGHCDVQHIEAPDFSHFHTEKVSFVAPLVATIEAIHNSQFTFENETQSIASLQSIRAQYLPTNLSGRAIIVRKAAYLI